MIEDGAGRKEVAVAVALLAFAAVFLWAVSWNTMDGGRRPIERALDEIAVTVERARGCNVPEAAIARFIQTRLTRLRDEHPGVGVSELAGDLLRRARFDAAPAPQPPGVCARIASHLASA